MTSDISSDSTILRPSAFDPRDLDKVKALARRQKSANSGLMRLVTYVGGQVEDGLSLLPKSARDRLDQGAREALRRSYDLAGQSRTGFGTKITGDRAHKAIATLSGALGGVGGLPTALIELPIATTLIFRSVQSVAESYGENPNDEETRLQCLSVFGAGGPSDSDDGIDTSFIGARLSLSGVAINKLIAKIAPRFSFVLGQKLAGQSVPILGAAAGAGTNFAFVDYYTEVAHVHFGLRALSRAYGEEIVLDTFHEELVRINRPILRA